MRTAPSTARRYLLLCGVALVLVVLLVFAAPAIEQKSDIVLLLLAVLVVASVPWIMLLRSRKNLLLGLFAFLVPFSTVDKWFFYRAHSGGSPGVQLSIADIVLVLLYALWLWETLVSRRSERDSEKPPNVVLFASIGFLVLISISAINAVDPALVGFEVLQTVKLVLWLVYLGYNISRVEHLRALGVGLVAAVFVHSLFAVLEKLAGGGFGLGFLGEQEGITVSLFAGEYTRVGGLIGHPVLLAAFFEATLPALLAMVACSTRTRNRVIAVIAVHPR